MDTEAFSIKLSIATYFLEQIIDAQDSQVMII